MMKFSNLIFLASGFTIFLTAPAVAQLSTSLTLQTGMIGRNETASTITGMTTEQAVNVILSTEHESTETQTIEPGMGTTYTYSTETQASHWVQEKGNRVETVNAQVNEAYDYFEVGVQQSIEFNF